MSGFMGLVFLIAAGAFFLLPVFAIPGQSIDIGYAGTRVSVTTQGSLSYAIFHCGEVHITGSADLAGVQLTQGGMYKFLCY